MRLFFAIWPPAATALALERWARAIGGRRVAPQKIHLTLAFLGDAQPERAAAAARRVEAARFALPIEQARYWENNGRKDHGIVWAGPRETPPGLARLVERLQLELYKEAFILERRPFAAHVTLVRKAPAPDALSPLPAVPWPVDEFLLVRSSLSSAGAEYRIVERFPLGC